MTQAPGSDRSSAPPVHVLVGILTDSNGRVLIARRPDGTHMAGEWEFPGGKRERGEGRLEALNRELGEELDIEIVRADPFMEISHDYADRCVRLDVWWVHEFSGSVLPREGQGLRWVDADELARAPVLAADAPIVAAIRARLGVPAKIGPVIAGAVER